MQREGEAGRRRRGSWQRKQNKKSGSEGRNQTLQGQKRPRGGGGGGRAQGLGLYNGHNFGARGAEGAESSAYGRRKHEACPGC